MKRNNIGPVTARRNVFFGFFAETFIALFPCSKIPPALVGRGDTACDPGSSTMGKKPLRKVQDVRQPAGSGWLIPAVRVATTRQASGRASGHSSGA
jgi:hypothetical protein